MIRLLNPSFITAALALLALRATAKGPLREALASGAGSGALAGSSTRSAGPITWAARAAGRLVGLFLTARTKVQIQEWLINRYRIRVNFQPGKKLERKLTRAFERVRAEAGGDFPGDFLEFGVYQGNSLICADAALRATGLDSVRLFGFDSFEGLPETSEDSAIWSPGQFRSDYEFTVERLREAGVDLERTRLIRGFYEESLTPELYEREGLRRASVIMLDCDLYTSTVEALAFSRPLIRGFACLFFDDWESSDEAHGQKRALREFRERHPELEFEEAGRYHSNSKIFLVRETGLAGSSVATG